MKKLKKLGFISSLVALSMIAMILAPTTTLAAQPKVNLGTTETFAVLAGTTITNVGTTTITGNTPEGGGNVGLYPGTDFTGKANVKMTGWDTYLSDSAGVALKAQDDLKTAYLDAAGRTPTETFTANDNQLGGKTLTSGVYAFGHADTANLTAASPLILDAEGNEEAVFIFQASSDLVMAEGSKVILKNGAKYCRIFWQVTSSATLGTNSTFVGHIFALTSISAKTGAKVQGQLLARNGAVTLDTNTIHNGLCVAPTTATLHVIKHVINDNGGKAVASDFKLHVKTLGKDVISSPAPGAEAPGTTYTLTAGTYSISEDAYAGYTSSYSGDADANGNITLAPGDNKTVTITNNDIAKVTPVPSTATLHVIKHVINDNGGKAVAGDFKLHVKTSGKDVISSPAPGVEAPGTTYTLAAGSYSITEHAFTGYTASYSGDADANGNITLAPGDNKTIIITNNDTAISPLATTPPTSTVTGGKLPNTSTNLYELLLIGVALTLLGALGWTNRKRYE